MVTAVDGIIARSEEVAVVVDFVSALNDLPGVLVVEGEAGIGKTTIWSSGVAAAHERSFTVLEARPTHVETKLAFAALGDLLGNVLARVLPQIPSAQRQALEIALLLEPGEGAGPDQRVVAVAFLNSLRALAAASPVLIAIDDVQWLDKASAATIEFAARRLRSEPVGFLLARRRESGVGADAGLALDPILRQKRIEVGPLSLGATHAVLHARHGVMLSRPVLRRLYELSGGNPFYALELREALVRHHGRLEPGKPFPMPDALRDLVAERLAMLPRETQDALTLAAAVSKPTTGLIAAVLSGDAYDRLGPAIEARVIEIGNQRLRFAHPLLAAAAYERASLAQRRKLHRTLSILLPDLEERAHHLALTAEGPDREIAHSLEQASLRAAGRGAQDAAADLCARAQLFTPAHDAAEIRRLSLREAEYALQSGDTPRARTVLERVLKTLPPGRQRAEVLTNLARVHFNGLDWRAPVNLLEQALLEADDDLALRAQIEIHLAINLDLLRTNVPKTLEHARAAVALAEGLGDEALLGEALMLQAKSELLLGRGWPDRLVERALQLEPATHALPADRWLHDYLASMRGWTDELDGAITVLEQVQKIALDQGDEVSLNWALARAVEFECYAGRWTGALRNIERGHQIALQAGQRANEAIFLGLKALAEAHLGLPASARTAAERSLELAEKTGAAMARRTALAALGFLELSLNHPREAHAYLAPLTAETREAGVGEPGAMRFLPDAIEALIALEASAAEALLDFLEERARKTERSSALAAARRCRGLLAAARGDVAAALAELERALAEHESVPLPFERARTLLALGETQRRNKQKRSARETLREALAIFERLGARLWAEKARAELARIGGRTPYKGELTPTERRVAELVAEGRSNKEVAAELFVTPKTVDVNLSRIYAKLGVHSRTELARRLAGKSRPGKV
jgi:DNA-binding CsgD family transcriptional regulator